MEAPKEIYLNYYGESAMWNERIESCDKAVKYIRADKAVDKDTLKEQILKLGGYGNVGEYDHGFSDAICAVIDKINEL